MHVGTHERAVRIVVFEEGNQSRSDRNQLLRTDVHEVDPIALDRDEVAARSSDDPLVDQRTLLVDRRIGLRDDVLLLFPCREVPGVWLAGDDPLLRFANAVVLSLELIAGHHLTELERAVGDLGNPVVIDHPPVFDLLVRTLDESRTR